ncbi:uncharacterized protein PV09_02488 [Verruconis gallopava]|uniref:NADP-dependent oxidoreductase domain-containing protein n=1 Tax=Verruconis gallopava TaxID=253628 RepID=A0A0D2AIS5_9PEZI|nr:uncharacterized protein PV09_02488 [Verruconis gallopava]KIW06808.1 hypothetical protein PV09_02488 [Verruconis gallopava]
MAGLKIVFGAASFNPGGNFPTLDDARSVLNILEQNDVRNLDTAQLYGESESILGQLNAGDRFVIDTKSKGGWDAGNSLQPDNLYRLTHESLEKLKVKQVDVFYIHVPDDTVPPSTWVPTMDRLHKEGVFKRFGVSNFTGEEVKQVYEFAKANNYVLPSVYQGNYSAVTRRSETELFPILREYKMAFYAYSPIAGGFLSKTKAAVLDGTSAGRFTADGKPMSRMYRSLYMKPSLLEALDEWAVAADEEGVSKAELAYRWVNYHSYLKPEYGDAIIIGSRNTQQLVETVQGLKKGPLSDGVVEKIEKIWEKVKHEAPLDNFNSFLRLQ